MTTRRDYTKRWQGLRTEQSGHRARWQDLSDAYLPHTGQFQPSERNDSRRRHQEILDSSGIRALRTLAAGMMAGMTSPARPWFRLTTSDPELDESDSIKRWLADVQRRMLMLFGAGNTYRALHSVYEELALYGTAANLVTPDFEHVVWHHPLTAGQYAIATDHLGQVTTLYRQFEMTVGELVGQFGLESVSPSVSRRWRTGNLDSGVVVVHAIEPRADRDVRRRDARNMPWRSVYFEPGDQTREFLSESGYRRFPAVAPRWVTSGGDVYGTGPGHESLGDVRALQHLHRRKAQAIDYQTMPPVEAPASMAGNGVDLLPGGVSYHDGQQSGQVIRPVWQVQLDLNGLLMDIQDTRTRIRESFYADLFLMLASSDRRQMTATEVAERHEEKLLMLGPVLERLHSELLSPLIDLAFDAMADTGTIPPPPPDLQGRELSVEFVSMLAQAQRAVATTSIDRFVANLGAVAQFKPEALDKLDADRWVDAYADMLGVDPDLIVPGERVAIIRQQRAEAQQAAAQAEQMAQQAKVARDLGAARTDQPNALTDVIQMFSGYTTPQGG